MMNKDLICIICPRGCHLHIEDGVVSGNGCKRGEVYAINEITNPTRTITTTVKIESINLNRLPVRSNVAIKKDMIFKCMDILNKVKVKAPVKMGQIIVKNINNSGVDIIATREVEE